MFTERQKLELAAFSHNAYRPQSENELLVPGWAELTSLSRIHTGSGFGAAVYQGPNGEIAIAFRGTDFNLQGVIQDFLLGNSAAIGIINNHVMEAIEVMADVMHALPNSRDDIVLTGHSLGGAPLDTHFLPQRI